MVPEHHVIYPNMTLFDRAIFWEAEDSFLAWAYCLAAKAAAIEMESGASFKLSFLVDM